MLPTTTYLQHDWALIEKAATVLQPFEDLPNQENQLGDLHSSRRNSSRHNFTTPARRGEQYQKRHQNNEKHAPPGCQPAIQQHRKFFSSGEAARRGKAFLTQELQKTEQALLRATVAEPLEKIPWMDAGGPPSATKSSFSSLYDKILEEHDEPATGVGTQAVTQMQMFLKEPTMGEADSPFQYWANSHARFPLLSAVATKFLSAPSTSVESERLFSTASNIVDEKRNRLTAERAEMLIFLKKNLPMFK
ncbi:uncharacterized protein V6R79_017286 [Siganus canaliculatus]